MNIRPRNYNAFDLDKVAHVSSLNYQLEDIVEQSNRAKEILGNNLRRKNL